MSLRQKKQKTVTAWIALSAHGYPAFFLGYHPTEAALKRTYATRFGHALKRAGYTTAKITIEVSAGIPGAPTS